MSTGIVQKTAFYTLLDSKVKELNGKNISFFSDEKYIKVLEVCQLYRDSDDTSLFKELQCRAGYQQAYIWREKFSVLSIAGENVLIYKQKSEDTIDSAKRVSSYSNLFDHIKEVHLDGNDHPKARTLDSRIKTKFGKSIPSWVQKKLLTHVLVVLKRNKDISQLLVINQFLQRGLE